MPPLVALAPILTAIAAAATIGTTAYELSQGGGGSGGSSASDKAAVAAQQKQQQAQQQAQQKAAFLAAQPNVQAQTGGGLTGTAFETAAATRAGIPSDLNSIARYLGLGSTPNQTSANVSGGITSTPGAENQAPTSPTDLQSLSDLLKG